jgi:hypothetical protein
MNTSDPVVLEMPDIVTGISNLVGGALESRKNCVSSKQQILIKFLVAWLQYLVMKNKNTVSIS